MSVGARHCEQKLRMRTGKLGGVSTRLKWLTCRVQQQPNHEKNFITLCSYVVECHHSAGPDWWCDHDGSRPPCELSDHSISKILRGIVAIRHRCSERINQGFAHSTRFFPVSTVSHQRARAQRGRRCCRHGDHANGARLVLSGRIPEESGEYILSRSRWGKTALNCLYSTSSREPFPSIPRLQSCRINPHKRFLALYRSGQR